MSEFSALRAGKRKGAQEISCSTTNASITKDRWRFEVVRSVARCRWPKAREDPWPKVDDGEPSQSGIGGHRPSHQLRIPAAGETGVYVWEVRRRCLHTVQAEAVEGKFNRADCGSADRTSPGPRAGRLAPAYNRAGRPPNSLGPQGLAIVEKRCRASPLGS